MCLHCKTQSGCWIADRPKTSISQWLESTTIVTAYLNGGCYFDAEDGGSGSDSDSHVIATYCMICGTFPPDYCNGGVHIFVIISVHARRFKLLMHERRQLLLALDR
jgi:hypothetical protein